MVVVPLECFAPPDWLGAGCWDSGGQVGIRILDPGRANRQAYLQQTSVARYAPLSQEDVFWGGFIGPGPRGGEHLNRQHLLMSAMLLIRTAWRGAAVVVWNDKDRDI